MMQSLERFYGKLIVVFVILFTVFFCSSLWAANIYVAPSGTGDGSISSPASLQDALDTANSTSGDHALFLEQGTYSATAVAGFKITTLNNSVEKSITLSGGWTAGYTNQSTDPETTKLDGGGTTRVLDLLADGGTAYTNFHVENLTIENGYVFGSSGAGIQADISSTNGGFLNLYIHGCLIRNNAARKDGGNVGGHGGGLYATGYVEVTNTTFESNSSNYHGGGIIFTYRSPYTDQTVAPKVDNCIFLNNYNVDCCPNGSAIANYVHLTVTNSRFEGQTGSGSPIHSGYTGSYLIVSNSLFLNNKIDYWGSAIQFWDSDGEIKGSVFFQNNAGWNNHDGYGAVTYLNNTGSAENITIINCTFLGNRSLTGGTGWGGALHSRGANMTIANSIFWDNGPTGLYSQYGNTAISYSDIQGGLTSTGFTDGGNNISDDPGFTPGDYHLQAGSPCIDTGFNAAAADITTDIDGEPRIVNGTVEMGADEYIGIITLFNPDTGDAVPTDEGVKVSWGAVSEATSFKLSYSLDGGVTWVLIGKDITETSTSWQTPLLKKNNTKALLKINAYDDAKKKIGTDKAGPFTIEVVTITSPTNGDILTPPDPWTVTWNMAETVQADTISLYFSVDNGITWKLITNAIAGNETSYPWTPSINKDKTKCKLKIVMKDGSGKKVGSAVSTGKFTIDAP